MTLRWIAVVLLCVLLCATSLAANHADLWLDVPFIKQPREGCGAASIAMVMLYWNQQQAAVATPNVEQIQKVLYAPNAHGIYATQMGKYFREHGFRTFAMQADWSDLEKHLAKGRPLIVALQPTRNDFHYVVITGLNSQQNILIKHDPAERKFLKQHRSEFEKQWAAAGNWTMLAVPDSLSQ